MTVEETRAKLASRPHSLKNTKARGKTETFAPDNAREHLEAQRVEDSAVDEAVDALSDMHEGE